MFIEFLYYPTHASGRSLSFSCLDIILIRAFFSIEEAIFTKHLLFCTSGVHLGHIELHEISEFKKITFGDLFLTLLNSSRLALGLYRFDPPEHYVYTNPPYHTALQSTDKVFILLPCNYQ